MALAQKYIDQEEMNAMKDSERREREQVSRRPYDSREGGGNKQKLEKLREPKYQPKYHNYTLLAMSREKALMMVENVDVLQWPRHTRDISEIGSLSVCNIGISYALGAFKFYQLVAIVVDRIGKKRSPCRETWHNAISSIKHRRLVQNGNRHLISYPRLRSGDGRWKDRTCMDSRA
ncbi:UNVERIFIED_CONTAM: hypothetical protein Sindi_1688900 [Sesamum indicum]